MLWCSRPSRKFTKKRVEASQWNINERDHVWQTHIGITIGWNVKNWWNKTQKCFHCVWGERKFEIELLKFFLMLWRFLRVEPNLLQSLSISFHVLINEMKIVHLFIIFIVAGLTNHVLFKKTNECKRQKRVCLVYMDIDGEKLLLSGQWKIILW
jgi:hypothetical protein